jgi:monoamine oxidase
MEKTILIAGAGICGLVLAKELLGAGKKVILLEAGERAGGRIATLKNKFSAPVDTGAEFIHGDLPHTLSLLKEAGIDSFHRKGKIYKSLRGEVHSSRHFMDGLPALLRKLKKLEKDIPFAEFLSSEDIDEKTKAMFIQFAEGFDAADTHRLSSFSVRDEWKGQNKDVTRQIKNGHSELVKYLETWCEDHNCPVHFRHEINEVHWEKDKVTVSCANGRTYEGNQIVITVPLGVLTSSPGEKGHINFFPPIPEKIKQAKKMGFGSVVKVILEFKTAFWQNKIYADKTAQLPRIDFLVSEEYFPTWWTYAAEEKPILTGWTGGPRAAALKKSGETEILNKALTSLSNAFLSEENFIRGQLINWSVHNWGAHPFSRGAYSYNTMETEPAKKIMVQPLEQTLFFAGEALNEEDSSGTVEAAIASAKKTAEKILGK